MVHRRGMRGRSVWSPPPGSRGDAPAEGVDSNWATPDDPAYQHIMAAAHELAAFRVDLPREELQRLAVVKGRADYARDSRSPVEQSRVVRAAQVGPKLVLPIESGVVYYMRIGNRVKIGWSSNILKRVVSINPEELMAVEPGGLHQERMRHQEFRALCTHGEWFRLESPLTEHIAALQRREQSGT